MDNYEITVGRFRKWVEALPASNPFEGSGKNPSDPSDPGYKDYHSHFFSQQSVKQAVNCDAGLAQTWTDSPAGNEARPMNCIDWETAFAFCIWDGGRLPTEAEWNYVAAGGNQQRVYPWSSPATSTTVDGTRASYGATCASAGQPGCIIPKVGSKPLGNSRWGQADMAGSVEEWVSDTYAEPYSPATCTNCRHYAPLGDGSWVLRGGSFSSSTSEILTSPRRSYAGWHSTIGARCAHPQ
jgi:formylglycine-generating enzyme required for sulfatase activity